MIHIILLMKELYNRIEHSPNRYKKIVFGKSQQRLSLYNSGPMSFLTLPPTETIIVPRENINKTVQIYSWRSKTSLPILRIQYYTVTPIGHSSARNLIYTVDASNNHNPHKWQENTKTLQRMMQFISGHPEISAYEVATKIQEIQFQLSDISSLSFPQALHLLKEMLVGFEVLIDIFGFFQPEEQMVTVNLSSQWKLWPNSVHKVAEMSPSLITMKQFIMKLVLMVQKFSASTGSSRVFFLFIKKQINENSCTFIKILQKINEYISSNKILTVTKVAIVDRQLVKPKLKIDRSTLRGGKRLTFTASNAQMDCIENNRKKHSTRFVTEGNEQYTNNNFYQNSLRQIKPGSANLRLKLREQNSNWQCNSFEFPKALPTYSHFTQHAPKYTPRYTHQPKQTNQSSPLDHQTYGDGSSDLDKHFRMPSIEYGKDFQPKISSKQSMQQPSIEFRSLRINSNKFSVNTPKKFKNVFEPLTMSPSQLAKIKSMDRFPVLQPKASISSIYVAEQTRFRPKNKKFSQNSMQYDPVPVKIQQKQMLVTDLKCTSPNNSSSTKQLQNSYEMLNESPNLAKLKQIDLAANIKARNNHSVINNHIKEVKIHADEERNKKNLAVSHQFHNRGEHSYEHSYNFQKNKERHPHNQWTSTITGLFDEALSIKQLKGSIKMKAKEEQFFEKQHLKDVKLDLLQKFGRKVNHIEIDEDPLGKGKYSPMQGQYKSMQLIEEEMEEVKSLLETDRKEEDSNLKPSKQITKLQYGNFLQVSTPQKTPRLPLYPNQSLNTNSYEGYKAGQPPEMKNFHQESGFNFQTQLYVLNPRRQ